MDAVTRTTKKLRLPHFVAVEVVIDELSDGNFQRELQRAVVESIRRFARSPEPAMTQLATTTLGTVFVRKTRPDEGPDTTGNFSGCTRA